jgi:hypothetical protein
MVSSRTLIVLAVCGLSFPGCALVHTVQDGTKKLVKDFTPESLDEAHPADDPGDPWIAAAASEGRAEQKGETANDPLRLRKYVLSNKAWAIENNLGIAEFE